MKAAIATIVGVVGVIILLVGIILLGWVFTGNDLVMSKFFSPKYEQVRRETFEQSKAYRQGNIQELQNMQFEYELADPAHKAALASIILRRSADFQELPGDLRSFIQQLKNTPEKY